MANYFSPLGNGYSFVDSNGNPLSGALLFTYVAGSTTKQTTYKNEAGSSSHTNPIVLDSNGRSPDPLWITGGVSHKFVLAPSNDTDPPASAIETWDNVDGVNDTSVSIDQWVTGPTPTFVSTTSLTLVGDQTSTFHVGRRVKTTDSGGVDYATIVSSAYTTLTTLTLSIDGGGVLDSGLSAISYALLSSDNPSAPRPSTYTLISTDAGATVGPVLNLDRASASPAASDVTGAVVFKGRDSGGGTDTYGQIQTEIVDATAASEDGKIALQTAVAGTLATRAYVAQGIVVGAATGGDQGVGTINATELYKNGSAIPTPGLVGPLATKTASSSASISFNSSDGISSTYNEYWVQLEHVVTAGSGDAILVRLDTNDGASFDAGATDYVYRSVGFDSGANDQASGSTGGTSIRITGGTSGVNSTANNGGCNSWVKFKNVNTTAGRKQVRFETDYFTSTNVIATLTGTGSTNSTTLRDAAVNAFQFLPSSANPIASGEFRLFGVKKS